MTKVDFAVRLAILTFWSHVPILTNLRHQGAVGPAEPRELLPVAGVQTDEQIR